LGLSAHGHFLHSVHTRVTLDFDGLRRSVIASQKVLALKDVFKTESENNVTDQVPT
jgi:hypothetical protein